MKQFKRGMRVTTRSTETKVKKRIEVTKGNNAVVCEITFNNALRISSEFPCIRMPQRMHSSRLVYVINKISEQNDTALLSIFSHLDARISRLNILDATHWYRCAIN